MNTKQSPKEIAENLLKRSACKVQMAAVISDWHGIVSWGWNNPGSDGYGQHAEMMALLRANKTRLPNATITVVGRYKKSRRLVHSYPCPDCIWALRASKITKVEFLDKDRIWRTSWLTEW